MKLFPPDLLALTGDLAQLSGKRLTIEELSASDQPMGISVGDCLVN